MHVNMTRKNAEQDKFYILTSVGCNKHVHNGIRLTGININGTLDQKAGFDYVCCVETMHYHTSTIVTVEF